MKNLILLVMLMFAATETFGMSPVSLYGQLSYNEDTAKWSLAGLQKTYTIDDNQSAYNKLDWGVFVILELENEDNKKSIVLMEAMSEADQEGELANLQCPKIFKPVCGVINSERRRGVLTFSNVCAMAASGARLVNHGSCDNMLAKSNKNQLHNQLPAKFMSSKFQRNLSLR
jgi:hypothetical protein